MQDLHFPITIILARCQFCKYEVQPQGTTTAQMDAWRRGELIQNALPHLPAGDREVLISGMCGDCMDEMFPDVDDEGEEDPWITKACDTF